MELLNAERLAREMMAKYRLDEQGWAFKFDRSGARAGYCNYLTKTIQLSKPYVSASTAEEARQTMLHEIAHALVGQYVVSRLGRREFSGHGRAWRERAASIGYTGGVSRRSAHHENEQAAAVERAKKASTDVAHIEDGPLLVGERVRTMNSAYRGLLVSVAKLNGKFLNDRDGRLFRTRLEYLCRETS